MVTDDIKTTQTSADQRNVKAILVEGPHAGTRTTLRDQHADMEVMNVAPRWSGIRKQMPAPPWWRLLARRAWRRDPYGKRYVERPCEPLPLDIYRYAGTLDDGTRVYRFDAAATWGTLAAGQVPHFGARAGQQ